MKIALKIKLIKKKLKINKYKKKNYKRNVNKMNFERDLENDGIFDKLYHYLWKFSDYFKEENARLKINIPHTIIFENLQPSFWYFSGDKDFIMKKKHESLCLDNIKSTFLTNISKSGIVAYFIFKKNGI